ncbi:MAG: outer membrane beta-barrel protein, partial [Steroidobacteraceae bacterium]
MKTMNPMNATGVALVLMIGSAAVAADDAGWYIGGNVGETRATIVESRIRSSLLASGFTMTDYDDDERDLGYKVFGGYQFGRFFALEGGYFDLGKHSFDAQTLPAGTLRGEIDVRGANLDLVGLIPFTDRFSVFVRAGANYAQTRDTFDRSGAVNVLERERREKETNYKFGGGLQYAFTDAVAMRIEAERYRIDDAVGNRGDLDLLSFGVVYRFGKTAPSPMPVAATAPASAPVQAAPAPASTTQYCSLLDFQFEINRDDIQREEAEKLAVVG